MGTSTEIELAFSSQVKHIFVTADSNYTETDPVLCFYTCYCKKLFSKDVRIERVR